MTDWDGKKEWEDLRLVYLERLESRFEMVKRSLNIVGNNGSNGGGKRGEKSGRENKLSEVFMQRSAPD